MNRYFVLICVALVALLATTAGTTQAELIVGGETYTEVFHDDFGGTGSSVASDNPGSDWDTGTGLDSTKWTWYVGNTSADVTLSRNGSSIAYLHSNALETDAVVAATKAGALAGLAGASQWAYEVVFELQTGGDLRDNSRTVFLLWGDGDVQFGLNNGATDDTFDVCWCLTRDNGDETVIFDEVTRSTKYTLQARHNVDHTVDAFLFETDTPANKWSSLGHTALTETPATKIEFGDESNRIAANLDLESVTVGYIPEPSTLALLAIGSLALLPLLRRRRKK